MSNTAEATMSDDIDVSRRVEGNVVPLVVPLKRKDFLSNPDLETMLKHKQLRTEKQSYVTSTTTIINCCICLLCKKQDKQQFAYKSPTSNWICSNCVDVIIKKKQQHEIVQKSKADYISGAKAIEEKEKEYQKQKALEEAKADREFQ